MEVSAPGYVIWETRLVAHFPCNSPGFSTCRTPSLKDPEPPSKSLNLSPKPSPNRAGRRSPRSRSPSVRCRLTYRGSEASATRGWHWGAVRTSLELSVAADAQPRQGLRSLASHTVRAHGVYADELRGLAGLGRHTPLCSEELSECHRELARQHNTTEWLHRPEVFAASAITREANYDDEQRRRRVEHLNAVRQDALEAFRRSVREEKLDPELARVRKIARSKARRAIRAGAECPICGTWFCTAVPVGSDYRQRKFCSDDCRA
jgi:hypothetical protein